MAPITNGLLDLWFVLVQLLAFPIPVLVQYYIQPAFIFSGLAFIHPAGILLKNCSSLGLIHRGFVASVYGE